MKNNHRQGGWLGSVLDPFALHASAPERVVVISGKQIVFERVLLIVERNVFLFAERTIVHSAVKWIGTERIVMAYPVASRSGLVVGPADCALTLAAVSCAHPN